jgi:hypothetical protein
MLSRMYVVFFFIGLLGCGEVTMPVEPEPDASMGNPDAEASSDSIAENGDASLVTCDWNIALIYIDHFDAGINPDTIGGFGVFLWSVIENDSPVPVSLSDMSVTNVAASANNAAFEIRPDDNLSTVSIAAHEALGRAMSDTRLLMQPLIGTEWNEETSIMVFTGSELASSEASFFITADVGVGDLIAPMSIRVDTHAGPAGVSYRSAQRVCFQPAE